MSARDIPAIDYTEVDRNHDFVGVILPCAKKAKRQPHFCVVYTNGNGNGHNGNGHNLALPDKKRMLRYDILYDENDEPYCERSSSAKSRYQGDIIEKANKFASSIVREAAAAWNKRYPVELPETFEEPEQETVSFQEDDYPFRIEVYGQGPKPEHGPAHFHLKYFPTGNENVFLFTRMKICFSKNKVYVEPWPYEASSRKAPLAIPPEIMPAAKVFAERYAEVALEAWKGLWKGTPIEHDIAGTEEQVSWPETYAQRFAQRPSTPHFASKTNGNGGRAGHRGGRFR